MRIVKLKQNTEEWMEFRKGKIGGSGLGGIWSTPSYNADDIKDMLTARGFDFDQYLEELKKTNPRKRAIVADDLKALLTDDDKDELHARAERKIGYYETLAEQVAISPDDDEDEAQWANAMDRGHGLEDSAAQRAAEILGKNIAKVGCFVVEPPKGTKKEDRAIYDNIYNSPDRIILPKGIKPIEYLDIEGELDVDAYERKPFKITEMMEVKNLKASKHLMAWDTRRVPEDYWTQKIQYFVTNENLETLYWVFNNPLVPIMPTFILVIKREDLGHWPATMLRYQRRTIKAMADFRERLIAESDNLILPAKPEKGIETDATN